MASVKKEIKEKVEATEVLGGGRMWQMRRGLTEIEKEEYRRGSMWLYALSCCDVL